MARKKVKIQWIEDDAARKAIYKKRMKGIMKKVEELSILCGVDACLIAYSPYQQQPQVWPSQGEAEGVVAAFRNLPENDQTKKVMNQSDFIRQRILKAMDDAVKQQMKNRKKEVEIIRGQCLGGVPVEGLERKDLVDLVWAIDNQLDAVKKRINNVAGGTTPNNTVTAIPSAVETNDAGGSATRSYVPPANDASHFWGNPFAF